MTDHGRPEKYYRIGSLEKGVKIIDLLASRGTMSLSEIAADLQLDRSVCHRSLLTLRDLGIVSPPGGSGYQLTMALFEMGMRLVNRLEVKQVVRPFMEELSRTYAETVNLGIKDGDQVVYLDKSESTHPVRADLAVGTRIPMHCTALGKAILAFRPENEQAAFCSGTALPAYAAGTITSTKRFVKELAVIRRRGFALDNEELYAGLRCVAAPVIDHTGFANCALSLAGPTSRISVTGLIEIGAGLKRTCARISTILGESAGDRQSRRPRRITRLSQERQRD
jgi:DNA-binding IclR family transcriptional regulator